MTGQVNPYIFAYCDTGYYEKYGRALENSARSNGHECDVFCSGELVSDELSKFRHSHWRYHMLPEILEKHQHVLMLDADCVVRKPALVPDGRKLGLVIQSTSNDWQRMVNGGCVYITDQMMELALKLKARMNFQHWFDDQCSLFRLCVKGKYSGGVWVINGDFFSWRQNLDAPIWTGKGRAKSEPGFRAEIGKWSH